MRTRRFVSTYRPEKKFILCVYPNIPPFFVKMKALTLPPEELPYLLKRFFTKSEGLKQHKMILGFREESKLMKGTNSWIFMRESQICRLVVYL
jgi:hypothetical protein